MSLATTDNHVFTRGADRVCGCNITERPLNRISHSIARPLVFERPSICSMAVMLRLIQKAHQKYIVAMRAY